MYAQNKGTNTATLTRNNLPVSGQDGIYASAVYDKDENCYIIKVANTSPDSKDINVTLTGLKKNAVISLGDCVELKSSSLDDVNSLAQPANITPQKTSARIEGNTLKVFAKGLSFAFYKVKL